MLFYIVPLYQQHQTGKTILPKAGGFAYISITILFFFVVSLHDLTSIYNCFIILYFTQYNMIKL